MEERDILIKEIHFITDQYILSKQDDTSDGCGSDINDDGLDEGFKEAKRFEEVSLSCSCYSTINMSIVIHLYDMATEFNTHM